MDNHPAGLGGAAEGAARDAATVPDDRLRVEELMRVNQRLAAEVRSLTLGRTGEARSSAMTAGRRLGALIEERDALLAELEATREAVSSFEQAHADVQRDRDRLAAEVIRLRGGWRGFLRRARARLSLRR